MLYFLGNCQMDFLGRAVADKGRETRHVVLASPLTHTSGPGEVPGDLAELVAEHDLEPYFHGRLPENQFVVTGDPAPELLCLNLFHENAPLLVHKERGYVFFMDPAAWLENPPVKQWIERFCAMIRPTPGTYLKRFGQFLAQLAARFPHTPVLVFSRLGHFPAFGPAPHSYLEGWDELSREAPAHFRVWERELENVHVVDLNRIFGGIWSRSEQRIEAHCPFLKLTIEERDDRITNLAASRDVEHIGTLWPVLAQKVMEFMETGEIDYADHETVPGAWSRPWSAQKMDEDEILKLFATGANYPWARGVSGFFMDLERDYTPLLARAGHLMPVCHNTLHMIKNYGRVFRNPDMVRWCDAHQQAAEKFTDNGPLYRAAYLGRVDEIRAFALS